MARAPGKRPRTPRGRRTTVEAVMETFVKAPVVEAPAVEAPVEDIKAKRRSLRWNSTGTKMITGE